MFREPEDSLTNLGYSLLRKLGIGLLIIVLIPFWNFIIRKIAPDIPISLLPELTDPVQIKRCMIFMHRINRGIFSYIFTTGIFLVAIGDIPLFLSKMYLQ